MVDADLLKLCQSTHEASYRASAFYGPTLTYESLPIFTDGSIEFTASGEIQTTASLTLARSEDGSAESLIPPKSKADVLAPYGQEIRIERVDKLGEREFVTVMSHLRIGGIPSMKAYRAQFPIRFRDQGWFAKVDLVDRFDALRADKFTTPVSPVFSNTTWEEIQRLSNIPIVRPDELPDAPLSAGIKYSETSRLDTITLLMNSLGGVPALTRLGALTGRVKDAWLTAADPVVTIDGVIEMDDSLTNDVYNSVRVASTDEQFVGLASITDLGDPLSVNGPLLPRVYTQTSPLYSTQSAVDAAAETILARVSTRRSKTVTVTCLPQPFLELGQFIEVIDGDRAVRGEISRMTFSMEALALMKIELIVAETR